MKADLLRYYSMGEATNVLLFLKTSAVNEMVAILLVFPVVPV
jgi:hypothetical protein